MDQLESMALETRVDAGVLLILRVAGERKDSASNKKMCLVQ